MYNSRAVPRRSGFSDLDGLVDTRIFENFGDLFTGAPESLIIPSEYLFLCFPLLKMAWRTLKIESSMEKDQSPGRTGLGLSTNRE